jgi:hypothetical protein
VLAAGPAAAGSDDGYPLRHLASHLHHAGRAADLHQLLATAKPLSGNRAANVWFTAHDTADCLLSYLDDLARARSISAAATDQAIARHQPAPTLGTEIRYALMATSITSRSVSISPELQDQIIRTGMWSPERGLDHARRLTDPQSRCRALMVVHKHAAAAVRPAIAVESLDAAVAISDDRLSFSRADALAALAPHLPADQLARALDAALALSDEDFYDSSRGIHDSPRARALTVLAPHLPADQLARAFDAALALSDHYSSRDRALTALAPHLSADQLARALDAAATTSDDSLRARA